MIDEQQVVHVRGTRQDDLGYTIEPVLSSKQHPCGINSGLATFGSPGLQSACLGGSS
jgi:hypothetical protein